MRKLLLAGVGGMAAAALALAGVVPAAYAEDDGRGPGTEVKAAVPFTAETQGALGEAPPAEGTGLEMPTSYPYQPALSYFKDNETGPNGEADYNTAYPGLMSHPDIAPRLTELMEKSNRVSTQVIGQSTQGRDLYLVTVTAPETPAQTAQQEAWKQEIRNNPVAAKRNADLFSGYKTPIWISNNIHGNEWEGTDAALDYIEYLATAPMSEVGSILRNNRVYFSPSLNPDGRTNATRATAVGLDPNRDMITLSTPEATSFVQSADALQAIYAADFHGYTGVLQFEPTGPPHGSNYEYDLYIPHNYELALAVQKHITEARIPGNTYLTEPRGTVTSEPTDYIKIPYRDTPSGWDDFPPIFTAQYAAFYGSITATVELPKGRTNVNTGNGTRSLMTPENAEINVDVAYESMVALVEHLNQPRIARELLENQIETFRRGVEGEPKIALKSSNIDKVQQRPTQWKDEWDASDDQEAITLPRAYVIPVGDAQRSASDANALAQRLIDVGLTVGKLDADTTVGETTYPKGSYIVDMHQPLRGLANALLDLGEDISLKLPSMYDISAWSLGETWGATVDKVGDVTDAPIGSYTPITRVDANFDGVASGEYLTFDLAGVGDYQAVNELLDEGVAVTMIADGSVVIADADADEVARVAQQHDVAVEAATKADLRALGEESASGLTDPKIAFVGTQDDRLSLEELGFGGDDLTQVTAASLTADPASLDDVDVLWIGSGLSFTGQQSAGRDAVQAFVDDGGSIVGRGSAAAAVASAFGSLQATAVSGNGSGNGIVAVDTPAGSVLEPYAQDTSFIYPAVSFTNLGEGTRAEQTYAEGNPLLAGHWRSTSATNGPESAGGQASVVSSENAETGARSLVFGTSVFFRNHPKGGLSQAARGIFWAAPAGEPIAAPKPKPSQVTVKLSKSSTGYGQPNTATITVTSAGAAATGKVKVSVDGKAVKTASLSKTGTAKVSLPAGTKPGTHTVRAEYLGSDAAQPKAATVKMKVVKAKPSVTAKLSKSKIKATQNAKVKVTVKLPGAKAVSATGKVQVKQGGKVLKTVSLPSSRKGTVTVKLPKMKKGTYTLRVDVPATSTQQAAKSKSVKLKVS